MGQACLPGDVNREQSSAPDAEDEKQSEVVSFEFAAISDQDKHSKAGGDQWLSYLQFGAVEYDLQNNKVVSIKFCKPSALANNDDFKGEFDEETDAIIIHTDIGTEKTKRGAEFSAICRHKAHNTIYVGDDKTGIIYELDSNFNLSVTGKAIQNRDTGQVTYIPESELNETNIDDRGYKIEWMTYRAEDGLYFGSNGIEFMNFETKKVTPGNTWVLQVGDTHEVQVMDWMDRYNAMRRAVGAVFPGWINIECIIWSEIHQSWYVLPRYLSVNTGFDASFDSRGCRILLIVPENGKDIKYVALKLKASEKDEAVSIDDAKEDTDHDFEGAKKIGVITREDVEEKELRDVQTEVAESLFYSENGAKGFSAAEFVPGTEDKVIIAVRSLETDTGLTSSLCIFDVDGNVFMEDYAFKGNRKYEGLMVFEGNYNYK